MLDQPVVNHLSGAFDRVTPTGKGVEQRHVRLAVRLVADCDLDDLHTVRIWRKHRRKAVNDDLVVVHQGDLDGLPGGGHTVGLPVQHPYQTLSQRSDSHQNRGSEIQWHTNGDSAEGLAFFRWPLQPEPTSGDDDHFDVIVPLRTRYASTIRMIAASLGAEAGFTVDEIDDLRLALDEVFSLLAERHVGDRVRTRFRLDGHQLVAALTLESGQVDVEPDELGRQHLALGGRWVRVHLGRCDADQTGVGELADRRGNNDEPPAQD